MTKGKWLPISSCPKNDGEWIIVATVRDGYELDALNIACWNDLQKSFVPADPAIDPISLDVAYWMPIPDWMWDIENNVEE